MLSLRSVIFSAVVLWGVSAAAAERLALPEPPTFMAKPSEAVTTTEQVLARALWTGLVRHDAQGRIVPGLAEAWTVNLTGTEYRFRLKADAVWPNGQRVEAQDVVERLEFALDPKSASPFYALLLPIKNAEAFRLGTLAPGETLGLAAPDKNTVVITLERPSHQLLTVLAAPFAAPAIPLTLPFAPEPEAMTSRGNGPFALLKKQNAYVLKQRTSPGREFEITTESSTANVAVGFVAPVNDGGRQTVYQLLINMRAAPLKERDVRHALSMVIDRDALVTALQLPKAFPAYGLAPDALQAPYAKLSPADRKTVAEALLLDVSRDQSIRVVFPDQPVHRAVGASLVSAWSPLGFKVELQAVAPADYERTVLNGDFDVAWLPPWGFGATRANQLLLFSQAVGPWNAGGYREAVFDQYLASADSDLSAETREVTWRRAEDILVEDQPAWPLFFYSTLAPQILDVTGWAASPPQ